MFADIIDDRVSKERLGILNLILERDGLLSRPFVLMGYAIAFVHPEISYNELLFITGEYIGEDPARLHSHLGYLILKSKLKEVIGPADYLQRLGKEVRETENRVSSGTGG